MKNRIAAIFLCVCLAVSICALPASASDDTGAEQTVRALGIMIGDEEGNMHLDSFVTRAEFAAMAVRASSFRSSVGSESTGYSVFSDVDSGNWASEFIKIAAGQSWVMGYTDGTYRPNQSITLEQACAIALRLLGYDAASLTGSYPNAQLNKAEALGLRSQVSAGKGENMTRRDCMYLFYNLLTAKTSGGQVYANTLGYTVTNGQVDYSAAVKDNLSGPYVCGDSAPSLSFTPLYVYLDGAASSMSAISRYDVYYYNAGMRTVWIYDNRAAGTVTAISPSAASPTSVTVNGTVYSLGTSAAAYKMSAVGGMAAGDTVMLLLGMDGSVADVVTGADIDMNYYGIVLSYSGAVSSTGSAAAVTRVTAACTDGVKHTFTVSGTKTYTIGALITASVTQSGTTVSPLTANTASGTVNSAGTKLGSLTISSNARILDTTSDGGYVKIYASRLAGCTLDSSDVRYCGLDSSGAISDLILDDVTGDTWQYGYMISASVEEQQDTSFTATYDYVLSGTEKTASSHNISYPVKEGGFAVRFASDGSIESMKSISSGTVTSLGSLYATIGARQYRCADNVQVLLYSGGTYYATTLSAVDASAYTLTAWYDSFGCPAGGLVRLIVAAAK